MMPTRFARARFVLAAVFLLTTTPHLSAQAVTDYADTTADFQRFLQEILGATKNGDQQKVESLLKFTEVPDCDAWLHRMYTSDSADSWMSLCDPKTLHSREQSMATLFARFAKQPGGIFVRKVNDNPDKPNYGDESGLVYGGKEPREVYFASWKLPDDSKVSKGEPIGYFYYVAGGFRWDSLVAFQTGETTKARITLPKLIKKVDPAYPSDASALRVSGTVRVSYIVGADGHVSKAYAISGKGFSDDPSLRQAAEGAVRQWQFEPATVDGKPIELGGFTADIVFNLDN